MSSEKRVSPAGEFESLYNDLYVHPHRNIALINAGIHETSEFWDILQNSYLLIVAKAKKIVVNEHGEVKIVLNLKRLKRWELDAMMSFSLMIDDIASRIMAQSPITHQSHANLIGKFNLGGFNTSINQIPGLESISGEEVKRKSNEPSSIQDYL